MKQGNIKWEAVSAVLRVNNAGTTQNTRNLLKNRR
jgi:hypothetical protein